MYIDAGRVCILCMHAILPHRELRYLKIYYKHQGWGTTDVSVPIATL